MLAVLVTVCAIVFSQLPTGFQFDRGRSDIDAVGGSLIRQLQWFPLFALSGLVVWWRRAETVRLLRAGNPFLLLFVLWATATILWSPYPEVTFRKLWSLYGVVLLALALNVAGWRPERLAVVFRNTQGALLVVSLLVIILMPRIGLHLEGSHAGTWRGLSPHKNHLGMMAGLALVLWTHAWLTQAVRPRTGLFMIGLALLLLLGSRSQTAALTTFLAVGLLVLLLRPLVAGRHVAAGLVLVAGILITGGALILFAAGDSLTLIHLVEPVANFLGRDISMTGRDRLWAMTLEQFRENWLLGYGYETFWLGHVGPSGQIAEELYWLPWQAHNGYIDVLNETGVIGALIAVAFLFRHFTNILRLGRGDRGTAALHMALLVMVLVSNLSESSLFRGLMIYWILLAFSATAVPRALLDHQRGSARQGQRW